MRIATWNVNSLKARLPRVEEWLSYARPDVLCMQETKVADANFPELAFKMLGYESAPYGDGRWNGVAILSKVGIEGVSVGFDGSSDAEERRLVAATCGGVRVHSIYVPNGRSVGSEHYEAKLEWLDRLAFYLTKTADPKDKLVVCGDFNIAPEDRDVWDVGRFEGATHVSDAERKALRRIVGWGLEDAFRERYQEDKLFSWWDYRAGDFHEHRGMRIDLILASRSLSQVVRYALIDRFARKGRQPSDHAPVLVDFDV